MGIYNMRERSQSPENDVFLRDISKSGPVMDAKRLMSDRKRQTVAGKGKNSEASF